MPVNISNVEKLGRKTLLQAIKLYESNAAPSLADDLAVNHVTTKQAFEEIATYAGPGLALVTNERGAPPQTSYQQIETATFSPLKYMLQVDFSYEAFEDEQKVYNVLSGYGGDMREGFRQAEEIYAANVYMNLANDATNNPGVDGVAFGSASHPIESSTYSNILSVAAPISPESFNDLLTILKRQPAYQADMLNPYMGEVVIECAPEQEMAALELQKSLLRPDTANQAANVNRTKIAAVHVNPWFENPLWWAIRGTNKRRNRRFKLEREAFNLVEFAWDRTDDSFVATARQRHYYGAMDWRDVAYSFAS